MARFYGVVGYAHQVETRPGVHVEVITERFARGDVVTDSVKVSNDGQINPDLSLGNSFSILMDDYLTEHMSAIRYVKWHGGRWSVSDIKNQHPRLILRVGGLYNGPEPTP